MLKPDEPVDLNSLMARPTYGHWAEEVVRAGVRAANLYAGDYEQGLALSSWSIRCF